MTDNTTCPDCDGDGLDLADDNKGYCQGCDGTGKRRIVRRCVICGCPEGGLYPGKCCSDPENIEED